MKLGEVGDFRLVWVTYICGDGQVHVNEEVKRQCGYCGLRDGHWYGGGCKIMTSTGYLLKKEDVDSFWMKVTQRNPDNRLQSFTIAEMFQSWYKYPQNLSLCVYMVMGALNMMVCYCNLGIMTATFCVCHLYL